jgi:hypothetical protein
MMMISHHHHLPSSLFPPLQVLPPITHDREVADVYDMLSLQVKPIRTTT